MSDTSFPLGLGRGWPAVLLAGVVAAFGAARAAGPVGVPESTEPRVAAGRVVGGVGLVASRGSGSAFGRVGVKEEVYSRDVLVGLPGLRAVVEPRAGSVRLTLWGNLPELSASPVRESAVILHDSRAYDLDFTLLRGRVALANAKAKGEAKVWLRAGRNTVELTLPEPGDEVAVELYGRWPAGVPFSLKGGTGEPVRVWEVYVLKGRATLEAGSDEWSMSAPPGRAYFHGDSVSGPDEEGPRRLAALPEWADPKAKPSAEAVLIKGVVEAYRGRLKAKGAVEAAGEVLAGAEKDGNKARAAMARRLAVYGLAAVDEVGRVAAELADAKHADARRAAVEALRHWIGSAAGRDEALYEVLVNDLEYKPREAETVMQLLHSPFRRDQPETYETLLAYLGHGKLAIRELAYWHLYRLAPAGRAIKYDPAGTPEERAKGLAEWRKLIPSGSLPPEKKPKGK
jgi:hypothetical protein